MYCRSECCKEFNRAFRGANREIEKANARSIRLLEPVVVSRKLTHCWQKQDNFFKEKKLLDSDEYKASQEGKYERVDFDATIRSHRKRSRKLDD